MFILKYFRIFGSIRILFFFSIFIVPQLAIEFFVLMLEVLLTVYFVIKLYYFYFSTEQFFYIFQFPLFQVYLLSLEQDLLKHNFTVFRVHALFFEAQVTSDFNETFYYARSLFILLFDTIYIDNYNLFFMPTGHLSKHSIYLFVKLIDSLIPL
jgi:hypothetical protein